MTPPEPSMPYSLSTPGPGDDASSGPRAATLMVVAGALELVCFGLLALCCLSVAVTPLEELQSKMQLPPAQLTQMSQVKESAVPMAVTLVLMGVVPGLAYLGLSLGVRRGRYVSTQISMLLVATQMIVLGLMFLAVALESMMQLNPVVLTFNVITLGSLLMLLAFIFKHLMQARIGAKLALRSDREPWDSPDE